MFLKNIEGIKYSIIKQNNSEDAAVITATSRKTGAKQQINLIEHLSDSGIIVW
jgi:hypothetical protein